MQNKILERLISKFTKKKILVVGDLILDHYIYGGVDRVSPEAPVPVVWANRERFVCGGAANVGLNLVSLGADVTLCGVLGQDRFGKVLLSHIKEAGINTQMIIPDKSRPTTLKTRILAHHQQVVRVDWESLEFLSHHTNQKILRKIKSMFNGFDAVIIEDYGKGVINPLLVEELVNLCKQHDKIITVDPKEEHFDYYQNVTSMTPNLKEAEVAAKIKIHTKKDIPLIGKNILDRLQLKSLLITLGEDGMMLFANGAFHHIPTQAYEVFDVTGAGDTVIAVFTLALTTGASYLQAATIANFAAGIVVGKLGAAKVTKQELKNRIKEA